MKRLIKKAEFYTADEMKNVMSGQREYVEIFKNNKFKSLILYIE